MPVVPRSEVLGYALDLASHLASSSREELIEQKNRRSRFLRDRLHAVFARELAMHDKTFVGNDERSEEHTSELQSLMRISYAVFCLKKKKKIRHETTNTLTDNHTNNHLI